MLDSVKNFLFEYFWLPIIDQSVHYNIYNTIVYAILFSVLVIYLVFPLVKKLGLSFNKEFFIAISPFVFLGGFTRSLRDLGIIDSILLETPIIYIILFSLALIILSISTKLEEKQIIDSYWHIVFLTGIILLSAVLATLIFSAEIEYSLVFEFTVLLLISSSILTGLTYLIDESWINYQFLIPVIAHYADSASTITALDVGAEEKHVVANLFIDVFGPYGMFLMKTIVIIPVTYYLIKEFEGEKRNYYLFLVAMLGLALATRNMTSIVFN